MGAMKATSDASAILRINAPDQRGARLGSGIAVLAGPRGLGDSLILSAPEASGMMAPYAFLVPGAAIVRRPFMAVDEMGAPIERVTAQDGLPMPDWLPVGAGPVDADGTFDAIVGAKDGISTLQGIPW
jgi:hypothetical protein